jgi:hypothetical protein
MALVALSPGKIYALLFLAVVVVYIAYFVVQHIFKRPRVEHFRDMGSKDLLKRAEKDCKLYNMRQEVMNIFELYMGRKPIPEEIGKYSIHGNEQDILIAVIKDFNIATSDVENKRPRLDIMRQDACMVDAENVEDAQVNILSQGKEEPFSQVSQDVLQEEGSVYWQDDAKAAVHTDFKSTTINVDSQVVLPPVEPSTLSKATFDGPTPLLTNNGPAPRETFANIDYGDYSTAHLPSHVAIPRGEYNDLKVKVQVLLSQIEKFDKRP